MNNILTITKIKTMLLSIILLVASLLTFNLAFSTNAGAVTAQDGKEAVCQGIGAALGSTDDCEDQPGDSSVDSTLKRVIDILSIIVSVIAVIMVIIGGFRFVTSSGDSGSTTAARNTVIYALVGLAIVALAQIIVRFTIGGVDEASKLGPLGSPDPSSGVGGPGASGAGN